MVSIMQIMVTAMSITISIRYASSSKPGRMIIYMEDEKPIIIPKSRPFGPLGYKFYRHVSDLINQKPLTATKTTTTTTKYVNHTPVRFKLLSYLEEADSTSYDDFNDDIMKKCCGNEWIDGGQEVPLYNLPGHLPPPTTISQPPEFHYEALQQYQEYHHQPSTSEDIKPVTEHIEDDFKYDFRTKTLSFR